MSMEQSIELPEVLDCLARVAGAVYHKECAVRFVTAYNEGGCGTLAVFQYLKGLDAPFAVAADIVCELHGVLENSSKPLPLPPEGGDMSAEEARAVARLYLDRAADVSLRLEARLEADLAAGRVVDAGLCPLRMEVALLCAQAARWERVEARANKLAQGRAWE